MPRYRHIFKREALNYSGVATASSSTPSKGLSGLLGKPDNAKSSNSVSLSNSTQCLHNKTSGIDLSPQSTIQSDKNRDQTNQVQILKVRDQKLKELKVVNDIKSQTQYEHSMTQDLRQTDSIGDALNQTSYVEGLQSEAIEDRTMSEPSMNIMLDLKNQTPNVEGLPDLEDQTISEQQSVTKNLRKSGQRRDLQEQTQFLEAIQSSNQPDKKQDHVVRTSGITFYITQGLKPGLHGRPGSPQTLRKYEKLYGAQKLTQSTIPPGVMTKEFSNMYQSSPKYPGNVVVNSIDDVQNMGKIQQGNQQKSNVMINLQVKSINCSTVDNQTMDDMVRAHHEKSTNSKKNDSDVGNLFDNEINKEFELSALHNGKFPLQLEQTEGPEVVPVMGKNTLVQMIVCPKVVRKQKYDNKGRISYRSIRNSEADQKSDDSKSTLRNEGDASFLPMNSLLGSCLKSFLSIGSPPTSKKNSIRKVVFIEQGSVNAENITENQTENSSKAKKEDSHKILNTCEAETATISVSTSDYGFSNETVLISGEPSDVEPRDQIEKELNNNCGESGNGNLKELSICADFKTDKAIPFSQPVKKDERASSAPEIESPYVVSGDSSQSYSLQEYLAHPVTNNVYFHLALGAAPILGNESVVLRNGSRVTKADILRSLNYSYKEYCNFMETYVQSGSKKEIQKKENSSMSYQDLHDSLKCPSQEINSDKNMQSNVSTKVIDLTEELHSGILENDDWLGEFNSRKIPLDSESYSKLMGIVKKLGPSQKARSQHSIDSIMQPSYSPSSDILYGNLSFVEPYLKIEDINIPSSATAETTPIVVEGNVVTSPDGKNPVYDVIAEVISENGTEKKILAQKIASIPNLVFQMEVQVTNQSQENVNREDYIVGHQDLDSCRDISWLKDHPDSSDTMDSFEIKRNKSIGNNAQSDNDAFMESKNRWTLRNYHGSASKPGPRGFKEPEIVLRLNPSLVRIPVNRIQNSRENVFNSHHRRPDSMVVEDAIAIAPIDSSREKAANNLPIRKAILKLPTF